MTFNQITHKQGQALAKFLATLRPDWDAPGIEYALGNARQLAPAPDLAIAAIKAASLASNRTPSVIAMEGAHWRGSEAKPQHREPTSAERCSVCFQAETRCRSLYADDHEFDRLDKAMTRDTDQEAVAAMKTSVLTAREGLCSSHNLRADTCVLCRKDRERAHHPTRDARAAEAGTGAGA